MDILGPRPASDKSYVDDADVLERIAHQYAAITKVRGLPNWAADLFRVDPYHLKMEKIMCSLVRAVHGAPGTSFGHVIDLPNFGRIFLGELTVERKHDADTFHLSMIRLQLDSLAKGTVNIVNVHCNGGSTPEARN